MIKAAFFDIDGTLVSMRTHEIPASTIHALEELRHRGVLLFLATGRSSADMPRPTVNTAMTRLARHFVTHQSIRQMLLASRDSRRMV